MSIACKNIREHWKQWENEICSFLGNSDTVICINHFNRKIRNYLLENNRYQFWKLDVTLSSKISIKRFIQSIKYFDEPDKIHLLNFRAGDEYFQSHPSDYLRFSKLFSKSKPMPFEFNEPELTPTLISTIFLPNVKVEENDLGIYQKEHTIGTLWISNISTETLLLLKESTLKARNINLHLSNEIVDKKIEFSECLKTSLKKVILSIDGFLHDWKDWVMRIANKLSEDYNVEL